LKYEHNRSYLRKQKSWTGFTIATVSNKLSRPSRMWCPTSGRTSPTFRKSLLPSSSD
jgi:hypothetical protein